MEEDRERIEVKNGFAEDGREQRGLVDDAGITPTYSVTTPNPVPIPTPENKLTTPERNDAAYRGPGGDVEVGSELGVRGVDRMEDEKKSDRRTQAEIGDPKDGEKKRNEWKRDEEVGEELAPPRPAVREREVEKASGGAGLGITALVLSILSLLFWPVVLGAAGIITGFFAYRRGAVGLGMWSMGIGAVSIIIALFITPFFR